jgi:hypothetical protein
MMFDEETGNKQRRGRERRFIYLRWYPIEKNQQTQQIHL